MKPFAEPFGLPYRLVSIAGAFALLTLAILALGARAHAAEVAYWNNYKDTPVTIGSANVDGTGGGLIPLGNVAYRTSEGMTYDAATQRLYVAAENFNSPNEGAIYYVNLDGSGGGRFTAPGAPVDEADGIVIDPATRMIYWANSEIGTISWAKLDGSAGGELNIAGAATVGMLRLAIDPAGGRIFWAASSGGKPVISFANLNGTGGGVLPVTFGVFGKMTGLATDPLDGRLYMIGKGEEKTGELGSVPLTGGTVSELTVESAYKAPYGLAVDPQLRKAYWGNYGFATGEAGALGFTGLDAGPGTISPTTHTNGAQDPVIIKSPTGTGAPQVSKNGTTLSCSQGTWSIDYPGANTFTAPNSFSYQWSLNGQPISGATSSTYTATSAGSYGCTVTGKNPVGSASQASGSSVTIAPPKLTAALLTSTVSVKAGKPATVQVRFANSGDLPAAPASVCAILTPKAKKGLVAPDCAQVAALGAGGSATATLLITTKKSAKGTYEVNIGVNGASLSSTTVSVKVTAAKKHKKHHKRRHHRRHHHK